MSRQGQPPLTRGSTSTDGVASFAGTVWTFEDVDLSSGYTSARIKRTNQRVQCRLVKNSSGIALLPKRGVTFKAGTNQQEVDGYVRTTSAECAGIVDEWLPAAGVANGDYFWIVVQGPTLVLSSLAGNAENVISERDPLVGLTAATSQATTAGRFVSQDLTGATAVLGNAIQNAIGRALSAKTTAQTNGDILVDMNLRWGGVF